jgi:hypothetical protein
MILLHVAVGWVGRRAVLVVLGRASPLTGRGSQQYFMPFGTDETF